MPLINLDAVLNPLPELKDHILDYIPRATTSKFGIVALGSGINVDSFGRISLDTQEYSNRLTAIETTAASTLETTVNTLEAKADELAASITQKLGMPNGIATLDSAGSIPSSQLPSYVDDVLEYENVAAFPATGETGKIYVETAGNTTYRWGGTGYVKITSGEVSTVAGKTGVVTLTKADVDLDQVDNTSDAQKPISTATQLALNHKINKSETYTKQESDNLVNNSISAALTSVNASLDLTKRGTANRYDSLLTYNSGERVVLTNGDIVKSTVDGNVNDPNVDMTGWVNPSALQAIHNKSSATFTDYLTANELANSATTDLSAKLQAINDANEISTLRLTGKYFINSQVVFNRSFSFDEDIDAGFVLGPSGSLVFQGSATLIGKPASNITNNSKTINIANSLNVYDLVCIYNPNDYSYSPHRANYKAGEFLKVASATPTSFFIFGRTYADYLANDVDIYKINPINISFNRFNIDATNSLAVTPVKFTFCEGLDASNFFNLNSKSAGVTLDRCYNTDFGNPIGTNTSALIGTNYGVVISNCQYMRVSGSGSMAVRHCMTSGGGNVICAVPCRELIISDSTFKGGSTTGITSADFHGNTEQSMYKDCVIEGLSIGGKNNTIKGCTIIGRPSDGLAISVGEIVGGYFDFIDCNLIINSNIANSFGAVTIAIDNDKDLREDLTINFKNLKINGKSAIAYNLIRVVSSPNVIVTKKITINIDGFDCKLIDHGAILYVQGGAAQPVLPDVEINMSSVKSVKKGIAYVTATSTAIAATTKLNLPSQSGSELITTASEASGIKAGAVITLPYSYPLPPSVVHSCGTDGTWSIDSTFVLKPVSTMLSINTTSQVRFALLSPSALPSKTFKVSWTASYNT